MNNSGVFLMNAEVWKLDKCQCQYCGLSGLGNFDVWMNLTIDHIDPSPGARRDDTDNLAVACFYCNNLKGGYIPEGTTRGQRIADAQGFVQPKRDRWRALFEEMMSELAVCS